ncbi:MAG: branched-chain amino acid ABC transporter permease [Alphaproteobacteria bacterium]|jgi:branched-chain amino acid transport system permease protein|nr:branched-chain amino acid ABC transporter permease [Alphaproteobacteria bacterium]MBT5860400.1 branched-chain amino acid ABC transporter permease [Alphaproteobacteria bacterium]
MELLLLVTQSLIYGIVLGSIITLGAIGVSLIFGILKFAHFAHGDFMTAGAYFAFFFVSVFGWPVWAAFPPAAAGLILMSLLVNKVVYQPLSRTRPVILLVAAIGMALIVRNLVLMIWGPDNVQYASGIELPYRFAGLRIKETHFYIVGWAVAMVVGLHLFLTYTKMGKAMRAMSDDPDLAKISGINTDAVVRWTWAISATFATAAGMFLAMDTRLQPDLGWNVLLPVFAATILGGIGRPYGAIIGAMIVGISLEMSTLVILPSYKPAVAFALMVAMLIWRPGGLLPPRTAS